MHFLAPWSLTETHGRERRCCFFEDLTCNNVVLSLFFYTLQNFAAHNIVLLTKHEKCWSEYWWWMSAKSCGDAAEMRRWVAAYRRNPLESECRQTENVMLPYWTSNSNPTEQLHQIPSGLWLFTAWLRGSCALGGEEQSTDTERVRGSTPAACRAEVKPRRRARSKHVHVFIRVSVFMFKSHVLSKWILSTVE